MRGKRAVSIDLKHPRGLELCRDLIARADIVVENMRPGAMERLGLGYAAAAELNPRLVYCSISGYGQNGPARDDAAMDLIMQAACGLVSVTGTPDGGLARCGHNHRRVKPYPVRATQRYAITASAEIALRIPWR